MSIETCRKFDPKTGDSNASHLSFEATLLATANKFRSNLDSAEYDGGRALALGLGPIFLKYISGASGKAKGALHWPSSRTFRQEGNPTTRRLARMKFSK